jgi:hypothetical protein
MMKHFRVGQKVKVARGNDNSGYNSFRDKALIVTHITKKGEHIAYDEGMYPEWLYDLKDAKTGKSVGSALYDYELEDV